MQITIHNAELVEGNGQTAWMLALEVNREDGRGAEMVAAVIPSDTVEWRVAEYGLDDVDDAELWSMIVHETISPAADGDSLLAIDLESRRARYLERHRGSPLKTRTKGQSRPRVAPGQPLKAAGPSARVLVDSDLDDPIATILKHTPRRREHVDARRAIVNAALERQGQQSQRVVSTDDVVLQAAERLKSRAKSDERRVRDR